MNTKPTGAGAGPKAGPPQRATARPLGIADIPGAIHPDEAARRGDAGGPNRGVAPGQPGQRPGGMAGGGMGGGGMGGGGDPIARGHEILNMLMARLSTGGEAAQRLSGPLNRISEGYTMLEQEVERLKGELAEAEEQIRVLLADGG